MQVNKITRAVFAAFDAYSDKVNAATRILRQTLVDLGLCLEDAQPLVIEWAAKRHGVAIVVSESNRNKGQSVLDRDAANFAAAKKSAQRMLAALAGDTEKAGKEEAEEIEIPAELLAAAAKLAKLAQEYEGARKLASKALAAAFAA